VELVHFVRLHQSRIAQQGAFGDHPFDVGASRYLPHKAERRFIGLGLPNP
jgi:hypothetical protein